MLKLIKWFLSLFNRKSNEVAVNVSGTYQSSITQQVPVKMDKPRVNVQKKQKYSAVSQAIKKDYKFIASRRFRKAHSKYFDIPMKRYYNY